MRSGICNDLARARLRSVLPILVSYVGTCMSQLPVFFSPSLYQMHLSLMPCIHLYAELTYYLCSTIAESDTRARNVWGLHHLSSDVSRRRGICNLGSGVSWIFAISSPHGSGCCRVPTIRSFRDTAKISLIESFRPENAELQNCPRYLFFRCRNYPTKGVPCI